MNEQLFYTFFVFKKFVSWTEAISGSRAWPVKCSSLTATASDSVSSNEERHLCPTDKIILTYFMRGSIIAWLTSCFNGLDSTRQVNLLII